MNNLNECENDLLKKIQQQSNKRIYNLGDVVAIMDVGNYRKVQEDSVLITNHCCIPDITFLMVADGMGGLKNGSVASEIASVESWNWFQSLDEKILDIDFLKDKTFAFIEKLDEKIRNKCIQGGTTFAGTLIVKDKTLIVNVGDSRVYIYDYGKLSQITIDHSVTQQLLEKKIIKCKDDMRFHKDNNLITSRLGCERKKLKIDFFELKTNEYEKIFLFTDGVTDCISDQRLQTIISNSINEKICENIIDEVMSVNSFASNLNSTFYYNNILAGKDNASIIYKKNR